MPLLHRLLVAATTCCLLLIAAPPASAGDVTVQPTTFFRDISPTATNSLSVNVIINAYFVQTGAATKFCVGNSAEEVGAGPGPGPGCAIEQFDGVNQFTIKEGWDLAAGADGERTVYVKLIDAGNNTLVVSGTITYEATPPTVSNLAFSQANVGRDGKIYTKQSTVSATLKNGAVRPARWAAASPSCCTQPLPNLLSPTNPTLLATLRSPHPAPGPTLTAAHRRRRSRLWRRWRLWRVRCIGQQRRPNPLQPAEPVQHVHGDKLHCGYNTEHKDPLCVRCR
jgi:hypothetical protein